MKKLLTLLMLLCMVCTGAWAEDAFTWKNSSTAITAESWAVADNWTLSGSTTFPTGGPAITGDHAWDKMYFTNASGTTPNLEGWAFKIEMDNSSITIPNVKKLQGTCSITLKNGSTLNMTKAVAASGNDGHPVSIDLSTGDNNVFNLIMGNNKGGELTTVNYGTVTTTTNRRFNVSSNNATSRSYNQLKVVATISDAVNSTTDPTLHSVVLGTLTNVTISESFTSDITATGYTQSEGVLSATEANVGLYSVVNSNGEITLYWVTGTQAQNDVTVNGGESKSLSEIISESGVPTSITVKSGATLDINGEYNLGKITAEDGATLIISTSTADISAITGNVNVVINVNEYSFDNSKRTQATGKLTINSGKKLKVGSNQSYTGSVSSFTSLLIQGTLWYQNKSDILHNVTLDGGTIHSEDMDGAGGSASGFTFSNALVLEGTTTITSQAFFTSRWNAQYDIKKLAGDGTLKLRGNGNSSEASVETAYFAIRDVEAFTGKFDILNTKAEILPLSNIKITNAVKASNATLNNVTIEGTERINTAGNVTINGVVSNNLTNSSNGYAFVGSGTLKLGGTMDLTKNGASSHNKIGYGAGTNVILLEGADVLTNGIYNSSTITSNANITIQAGAKLKTKEYTRTPNLTNNGSLSLVDLTTRYTATTVSGDAFNVEVTDELLNSMSSTSCTVVTGVTTFNPTTLTVNGQAAYVANGKSYSLVKDGNNINIVYEVVCLPEEGKTYYIYSDNKATTTGGASAADAQYYLYYNGSNLGLTDTKAENTSYMWTCAKVGDKYTFRNVQTGTYMGFKAMSNTAYQFTVSTSNAYTDGCVTLYGTNKYLVIPNGGTGFDQADGTYNKGTTGYSTDFVFEECDPYAMYFSEDYAHAKWLRITNAQHTGYAMTSKGAGAVNGTAQTDASLATQLYAFVGDNTNGFYIYNKQLGADYKLTATATSDGTGATWTQGEAAKWYLDAQYTNAASNAGFVITTQSGTSTKGLNIWEGAGGDTKFWNASGAGSHWQLAPVESEPTIIHYAINGTKKHNDANPYMGRLSIQGGSFSSQTFITAEYNGRVVNAYMPKGTTSLTFTNYPFHGWTYSYEERGGQHYVTYTADQDTEYQYLWMTTGAAHPYRIPAIATLKNGNIIAVNDYRPCGGDIGNGKVDLVKRISSDNGHTWSTGETIIEGNTSNDTNHDDGFGDPAIVVDSESGRVLLMCVTGRKVCTSATREDPNRVARFYSNDNGQTFTGLNGTDAYDDITEEVYSLWDGASSDSYTMQSIFIGSGRIFQSRTYKKPGSQYYRLYAALWSKDMHNRVMYSDDFGETWHILGGRTAMPFPSFGNANEPKCEELPDGSVIMSSRKPNGRYYNIFTYTNAETGEGSWGTAANSNISTTDGNGTNGEIMVLQATRTSDGSPRTIAIQSLPQGPNRSHLVFYYKDITEASAYQTDGVNSGTAFAANWTKGMEVTSNDAGYSTFTIQTDQRFGLFYEEGPAGYEMVYVPLTLEDITSGAYTYTVPADYIKAYTSMKAAHADKSQIDASTAGWLDYIAANPAALAEALSDADPYATRSVVELYNGGTPVITIASLNELTAALNAIQMVQKYRKGCFVRLQGYSGNYVSGNKASSGSNAAMSAAEDKTTIFYLTPEGELINYGTGIGFVSTRDIPTEVQETYSRFVISASGRPDKYYVRCNNNTVSSLGTYLYDNTANGTKLDRNGDPVTDGSYQTDWTITEVTALPVTIGSTKFATFFTPVELQVPAEVTAYVCNLDGENLAMYTCKQTDGEHTLIPAGTAVMLNAPEQTEATTTYDFTIPAAAQAEEYSNNSFFGNVATKAFAEDYTYYSLQRDQSANDGTVGFFIKPSGNFKGFQAFLKTENTQQVQRFNVTFDEDAVITGFANVLGTVNINIPAFDLSGRKVDANSHRGLYIMNGKKVIR